MGRLQVLMVLFAGVAFGSASTGCFALWLGVARADGASPAAGVVLSAPCNVSGPNGGTYAVLALADHAKEDIAANVYALATPHDVQVSTMGTLVLGSTSYPGVVLKGARAGDGSAAILCEQGESSAQFYVRQ